MAESGPSMRPLRVLHVIPTVSPRDGGPARAIGIIERALCEAGVRVTTLTTNHDVEIDGEMVASVTGGVRRIYARKWFDTYKVAPGLLLRLMQEVERHDVVHIHFLFSFASTAAAWVARHQRVPYIIRPLGTLCEYGMRERRPHLKQLSMALIEGQILRHAAAIQFTSTAEREETEALGVPIRGVVIPLGVDQEDGPAHAPVTHAALAGRHVILFLSRLDPKKNAEALIDAVAASPMLRNSCALLMAGTGTPGYVAGLQARAAAAGLLDRTVWLGHVEGVEKRAALKAADVFVLPSFSENFGIAAVEALLAGLPCVLGTGVAIARDVEEAGAGLAVAPEPTAIARALEDIVGNEYLRSSMGARAPDFASRQYSVQTMAQRLLALYEQVVDCGR